MFGTSMVGTSWLMKKLFEIFCFSSVASELTRLVRLKCFLKWSKIFLGGHFPGAGFKVDSCFLAREMGLSSFLLIADWLILVAFALKYLFFKNLALSLILFRVFDG